MNVNEFILIALKKQIQSKKQLEILKKSFSKKNHRQLFKNYELLKAYRHLLKAGQISPCPTLEKTLKAKPIRTLSGVAPLTVLSKPFPCPGHCLYCPDQKNIPRSYLSDEPAVLRAAKLQFSALRQVRYRLKVFQLIGHPIDKIELIILGGSFSHYPRPYRRRFIKDCFDAANHSSSPSLVLSQQRNATASSRLVGITVETRPDLITPAEVRFLRQLGVTRVELGVQSLFPEVLKKNHRGHGLRAIICATKLLKNAGFKVCYHLMPGLPGSNRQKDLQMFKKLFQDSHYRPDYLKIYPCVVLKDAPLYNFWRKGEYQALGDQELIEFFVKIKPQLPPYVRINRLGRDIPIGNVVAGYRYSHLRQLVKKEMDKRKLTCHCIRCREVRSQNPSSALSLKIIRYQASGAWEYFFQFVDSKDRLYGLLRLRLSTSPAPLFPALKSAALVRELHVYGSTLSFGEKKATAPQHQGLGQKLLQKAEQIASQNGYQKIAVISGVGVRDYYRRFGYSLKNTYLVKNLS